MFEETRGKQERRLLVGPRVLTWAVSEKRGRYYLRSSMEY